MEVITLQQKYTKPIVLCLGFFDCMHTGHVKLLEHAKHLAAEKAQVALFTFSNSHFEALKRPTKLIYTFDERLDIYDSLGVDVVISAKFDAQFMSVDGEHFLDKICAYNLVGVVCGADYTCGSNLMSATAVQKYLQDTVPVEIVQLVKHGEQKACSNLVRNLLSEGLLQQANTLLSQPFFYTGIVAHGRNVGQTLGFPTVNLSIPAEKMVACGVYAGICYFQGGFRKAVVNVGAQPTFGCDGAVVEAHLLDFDGNLYGQRVKIALVKYLRPVQKFDSAEQLRSQLQQDTEAVLND